MTRNVQAILDDADNQVVMKEFFEGFTSGDFFDGVSHQLYLDTRNNSMFIRERPNPFHWIDDQAMLQITQVYRQVANAAKEQDFNRSGLEEAGFVDWIDEVRQQLALR